MQTNRAVNSERGSALLITVFIIFLLTILGVYATTISTIDIQIASNDRDYIQVFYAAEGGWQVAISWLDYQYPLASSDLGLDTSGGGVDFTAGKYDTPDSLAAGGNGTYAATVRFDGTQKATGYSTDFRRYMYTVTSTASGQQNAQSQAMITAIKVGKAATY